MRAAHFCSKAQGTTTSELHWKHSSAQGHWERWKHHSTEDCTWNVSNQSKQAKTYTLAVFPDTQTRIPWAPLHVKINFCDHTCRAVWFKEEAFTRGLSLNSRSQNSRSSPPLHIIFLTMHMCVSLYNQIHVKSNRAKGAARGQLNMTFLS